MNYNYSIIEEYVKNLYHQLSIYVPHQIDMIDIAVKLDVWLHFEDVKSKAIEKDDVHSIFIDNRLSSQDQWQDFAHELCHVLMHCGNQLNMPADFIQYQESKAKNFAYHFCIPTFMLEKLYLPVRKKEAIGLIANTFNVKYKFAKKRLEQWILQRESNLFYEKMAESRASYQTEIYSVINLDHDIEKEIDEYLLSERCEVIG
jgi:Zn-dependent peptidase ImmA (M78 family)